MKKAVAFLLTFVILFSLTSCGNSVKIKFSSSELEGQYFEDVIEKLKKSKFTNIETNKIDDLTTDTHAVDGYVESVSINGLTEFDKKTEFEKTAKIIITYHNIPKIKFPLSQELINSSEYTAIGQALKEAGFTNVSITESFDLDPDDKNVSFKNEINIDGNTVFEKNQEIAFDAPISVICHLPYAKRSVKAHVKCYSNLLFSKYDIYVKVDDKKVGELAHGSEKDYNLSLKEGEHTITFESQVSSSVIGSVTINVIGDMEVGYTLSCNSDNISVDEEYKYTVNSQAEDEVQMPLSESSYTVKDYKQVVKELQELGFTNIKTLPDYDVFFGILTSQYETKVVSIDDNTSFKKGDVFRKDAKVIVKYHELSENAPENNASSSTTTNLDSSQTTTTQKKKSIINSNNDLETAKKGISGIFTYKNDDEAYDNYYIIDFDKHFVYHFCDGNGETTCDRVKIKSGNLNDKIIITYHDGDSTWSYGLHFKWKSQPSILIVQDEYGFEYEFYETDLSDALSVKDTKKVIDY